MDIKFNAVMKELLNNFNLYPINETECDGCDEPIDPIYSANIIEDLCYTCLRKARLWWLKRYGYKFNNPIYKRIVYFPPVKRLNL